jgi:cell division protease FtsH
MARQMVVNYGFSDIGPWSLLDQNAQSGDMIMRMMARNSTSESLQRKIDVAVKKIASEAYEVALDHIRRARARGPGRRVLHTFSCAWGGFSTQVLRQPEPC